MKTRSTQRRVLRRLRAHASMQKIYSMTTVTASAITGPSSDTSVIVPLYSTLSMSALTYSVIYCLAFNVRRRRETPHAPTSGKRKIEWIYRIMALLTIAYSLITTFMSIPNYAGDDKERNLKHALLNISADIAALSQCVACCFGVLRYRRSMKDPTWVFEVAHRNEDWDRLKTARTKAFSAQTRVSRFTITLPA